MAWETDEDKRGLTVILDYVIVCLVMRYIGQNSLDDGAGKEWEKAADLDSQ